MNRRGGVRTLRRRGAASPAAGGRSVEEGEPVRRLRSSLRRHGLVPRPDPVRSLIEGSGIRFSEGNRLELFESGRDGLAAMLRSIAEARRFVHLETYILRGDATGQRFLAALAERAEAGVSTRLLYDAYGSLGLDPGLLDPLRRAGGAVVAFNPLRRLYPRWAPRRRDHRKLLVVDGAVGFLGGLNIGDEYDAAAVAPPSGQGWRDTHVRVEGPAVRSLGAIFLESWFRADGPNLPWELVLSAQPPRRGEVRCAVVPDGPTYSRRTMRDLLVTALDQTRVRARLTTAYFSPGRKVLDALERAAERGARVELVLAGRTDHPVLRRAARSILPRLLERGVHVYEYAEAIMHAKSAVFDGSRAVLGTSNLDRQSFEHSYEVNLVAEGADFPERLDTLFERDLARSRRVDLTSLAARGPFERLVDRLAALLLWVV